MRDWIISTSMLLGFGILVNVLAELVSKGGKKNGDQDKRRQ